MKTRMMNMIRVCGFLLLYMTACPACAQNSPFYHEKDSLRLVKLLQQAVADGKGTTTPKGELMVYFARKIEELNVPYVAHTLEPFDKERLIVNLYEMDCTTFAENVTALTLCIHAGVPTFEAFCHILQKLRYEQGDVPDYKKRLHYFTSWIEDNTQMGFCHEIQSPAPPFTATQTIHVDYMTRHPDLYRMLKVNPSDIPAIGRQEALINGRTYQYIPIAQLADSPALRSTVSDGDIIAIVTNKAGLDTQHIAIAVWHDDGLHMLHASSLRHKVVEERLPLRQYLIDRKTAPGIRIIRLN